MLKCNCCGIEKNEDMFSTYLNKKGETLIKKQCKECIKRKDRERNKLRKEQLITYRLEHKEYFQNYHKKYYVKYKEENDELLKEKSRNYYYTHIEKRRKYERDKRKSDALYRIKANIRNVIKCSFKRIGAKKKEKTEMILGCTIEEFIKYLYQTYKNNYGCEYDGIEDVHIDHIIPLATAKNEQDVFELCNYKNLQLLKKKDNLEKNCKLDYKLKGM